MAQISGFVRVRIFFLKKTFIFAASFKKEDIMLIIDSKDCENIDKALKKYKKKFEKSRVLLQLRERQAFIKPSIRRRTQVLKAVYKQQMAAGKFDI
jgi:small subunit ribosomal protein S21